MKKSIIRSLKDFIGAGMLRMTALAACGSATTAGWAETVNAVWNTAADVPITASNYMAAGNTVNFTLNFAPPTGTELMVVKNTALGFIGGAFANLAPGQPVALSYGGIIYHFVANYYGGSGNDLVLVWADNRTFTWGENASGMPAAVNTDSGVSALYGKTVVAIAAGEGQSLALCSDGTVATWGTVPIAVNTNYGVSALYGKRVVAIAMGGLHSLALCSDGTVAAWGNNTCGQLGDNQASGSYSAMPVAVNTSAGVSALHGKTVVAIAGGDVQSLALCSDGTLASWGLNNYGELGDNTTTQRLVPVAVNSTSGVSALYGKTVVAISVGFLHSVALCSDGTVIAWGDNRWGQLGDGQASGTYSPVPVAVNTAWYSALHGKKVIAIAAGYGHDLALCSDGTLAAWGYNYKGELGDGNADILKPSYGQTVPVLVNTASGTSALYGKTVVAIAAGDEYSSALCSDGTMAAWGDNFYGQLGDNQASGTQSLVPVAVNTTPLPVGQFFVHAVTGSMADHMLALVAVPAVPLLQVQQNAGMMTLQWDANFLGFVPQANFSVANLDGWADLTNTPVLGGPNCSLTFPTTNAACFFRLRSP